MSPATGWPQPISDRFCCRGNGLASCRRVTSPNYSEPAGGWKWVTGEPWAYTNWHVPSGQPDNSGGREEYIRSNADWAWDDFPDNPINPSVQYISGYFVEYTVPEPGVPVLT